MPRKPRLHIPGMLYHVLSRGNDKSIVFPSEEDYFWFIKHLKKTQLLYPFTLHAYCLMPNHFHLLIEVGDVPLSHVMQRLLTAYTMNFNHKNKRVGHLFQGRYKAIMCQKESYLLELVRYIHLNPVRAKIVADPAEWRWSSYMDYIDGDAATGLVSTSAVLGRFGGEDSRAVKRFRTFINEGVCDSSPIVEDVSRFPGYLGDEQFVEKIERRYKREKKSESDTVGRALDDILGEVAKKTKVSKNDIIGDSRDRMVANARKLFILKAIDSGHRGNRVARYINRAPAYITRIATNKLKS